MKTDVLIVGTGVGGLYCALNLPQNLNITLITKSKAEECDSFLAQGGICVLKEESDYDSYFEDTLRAGHYENNKTSVELMIRHSPEIIKDLIHYGARFEKDDKGNLLYTKEGAHSVPRILYHEDITGKEITTHLLEAVRKLENVTIHENIAMLDIIEAKAEDGNTYCKGIVAKDISKENEGAKPFTIFADETVWACGGIGGLFQHSTNFPHLTGDALGIALKHNIPLQNPDYIQIHPTTLYIKNEQALSGAKERSFLISESVRGEGGILYNKKPEEGGKRFVNELLPRDLVTKAILEQMKKDGTECVWLSMENISKKEITEHFKHIYEHCLSLGWDCTKEPIPVVPAQHYFMGGVDVNSKSRTSMNALYAVGETSCNGVHGKNRLASNSLLESLVFARIAARSISKEISEIKSLSMTIQEPELSEFENTEEIFASYRTIILDEIKRMEEYHERNHA